MPQRVDRRCRSTAPHPPVNTPQAKRYFTTVYPTLPNLRLEALAADFRSDGDGLPQLAAAAGALAPTLTSLSLQPETEVANSFLFDPAFHRELDFVGQLTALRALSLTCVPLDGLPKWLTQLSALSSLQLNHAVLSRNDLPALAGLPALTELAFAAFVPHGALSSPSCPGVVKLSVDRLHKYERLPALQAAFPGVVDAQVGFPSPEREYDNDWYSGSDDDGEGGWTPLAGGAGAAEATARWRNIRRLELDDGLADPGCHHPHIMTLLRLCGALDGQLRELSLKMDTSVREASLFSILEASPHLEALHISECRVTDETIRRCPPRPALRKLYIGLQDWGSRRHWKAAELSAAGLLAAGRKFPGLVELHLPCDDSALLELGAVPPPSREDWYAPSPPPMLGVIRATLAREEREKGEEAARRRT
jgi:hypothetical protein